MAALAADKELEMMGATKTQRLLMKASHTIYKGAMVCVDTSTGLAESATYAANKIFAGIATERVASAATGGYWIEVWLDGRFKLDGSSLEQADVGKHVQVVDDQTVNDVVGATPVPVGIAVEYISATAAWVDIRPFGSPASTAAA